jgi:uncharacterized phiE125 gp8 family phage protein
MIKACGTFILTHPRTLPVTVEELKHHSRISVDYEDSYITSLINTATDYVEGESRQALITRRIEAKYTSFGTLELPLPPLQQVEKVEYLDQFGVTQILETDAYGITCDGVQSYVYLQNYNYWPIVYASPQPVTVTAEVGYGESPIYVPPELKHAILLVAGFFYENRESASYGGVLHEIPFGVRQLLSKYTLRVF